MSTQGKGDEAALRAAIATEAAYHAFLGSRRKMAALREKLIAVGVDASAIDRVKAPAGLDLGAITPEEITIRSSPKSPSSVGAASATPKELRTNMQMNDSQRIPASKEKVWEALNNPDILRQCIPGCQSLEMSETNEMTATVVFKVGPVKATFGGKVTLSDLDPPNSTASPARATAASPASPKAAPP